MVDSVPREGRPGTNRRYSARKRKRICLSMVLTLMITFTAGLGVAQPATFTVTELESMYLLVCDILSLDMTNATAFLQSDPDTVFNMPAGMSEWFVNATPLTLDDSNAVVSPLKPVANGLEGGELLSGHFVVAFQEDGEVYEIKLGPDIPLVVEQSDDGALTLLLQATRVIQRMAETRP